MQGKVGLRHSYVALRTRSVVRHLYDVSLVTSGDETKAVPISRNGTERNGPELHPKTQNGPSAKDACARHLTATFMLV